MKICDTQVISKHSEGFPVELHRYEATGRLVVRPRISGDNSLIDTDLWDLLDWCKEVAPRANTDSPG